MTLLSTALFVKYTTNPKWKGDDRYQNASQLSTLESVIQRVELTLNSQTKGLLYKKYDPKQDASTFVKTKALDTNELVVQTLYTTLTKSVEYYYYSGGMFVDINVPLSGNVNTTISGSSANVDLISLRTDILGDLNSLELINSLISTNPVPRNFRQEVINKQYFFSDDQLTQLSNIINSGSWFFNKLINFDNGIDTNEITIDGVNFKTYKGEISSNTTTNVSQNALLSLLGNRVSILENSGTSLWEIVNNETRLKTSQSIDMQDENLINLPEIRFSGSKFVIGSSLNGEFFTFNKNNFIYGNSLKKFDFATILGNYGDVDVNVSHILPLITSGDLLNWNGKLDKNTYDTEKPQWLSLISKNTSDISTIIAGGSGLWETKNNNTQLTNKTDIDMQDKNILNIHDLSAPLNRAFSIHGQVGSNVYTFIISDGGISYINKNNERFDFINVLKNYESINYVPPVLPLITEANISTWNGKQNKLTAGNNITINNDVISSTTTGTGLWEVNVAGQAQLSSAKDIDMRDKFIENVQYINSGKLELDLKNTGAFLRIGSRYLEYHSANNDNLEIYFVLSNYIGVNDAIPSILPLDITNWNGKQDKLIAGSNITITGNTISSTGGGSSLWESNGTITKLTTAQNVDMQDKVITNIDFIFPQSNLITQGAISIRKQNPSQLGNNLSWIYDNRELTNKSVNISNALKKYAVDFNTQVTNEKQVPLFSKFTTSIQSQLNNSAVNPVNFVNIVGQDIVNAVIANPTDWILTCYIDATASGTHLQFSFNGLGTGTGDAFGNLFSIISSSSFSANKELSYANPIEAQLLINKDGSLFFNVKFNGAANNKFTIKKIFLENI